MEFLRLSGRYQLLTKQEEVELGRRIQKWLKWDDGECPRAVERSGQRAREKFVLCNMRLITKIAKSYTRRLYGTGLTFEDLLQEGIVGLTRAAEKYDPECGYAMSTYATWWIRQAMSRAVEMKGGMIHISSEAKRKLRRYEAAREDGMSHENAMAEWDLKERDVFTMRQAAICRHVVALDSLDLGDIL
jgi:RNA polymerase primary sigma factor